MRNLSRGSKCDNFRLIEASKIKENTKLKYRKGVCLFQLGRLEEAGEIFKGVTSEDKSLEGDIKTYMTRIK